MGMFEKKVIVQLECSLFQLKQWFYKCQLLTEGTGKVPWFIYMHTFLFQNP